jgi:hypothetical protein
VVDLQSDIDHEALPQLRLVIQQAVARVNIQPLDEYPLYLPLSEALHQAA